MQKTCNLSETVGYEIGPRLLRRTARKSHTRFSFVPKSMTLDDLKRLIRTKDAFHGVHQRQKCRTMILVSRYEANADNRGCSSGESVKRQCRSRRQHFFGYLGGYFCGNFRKNFKFCTHIRRIDRNKSPLKMSGKVAFGVVRDSPKFSGNP